jgi:hypothetical protein
MDMVNGIEDVRLDWEIVAHTSNGQTYSINHGSIGTFKRSRWRNKKDMQNESNRDQWTFNHGLPNSVWNEFRDIIYTSLEGESGMFYDIDITLVDTGHFTKLAYNFITSIKDRKIFGIKGDTVDKPRANDKNSPIIKHSQENKGLLYILDVNMLKDQVASNMALVCGTDGTQPSGFMNFPQPSGGKYNLKSYFSHYESEVRIAKIQNGQEVGFIWKKKREDNHFWDICNYGLASREVFIADLKRQEPKNRDLNWISFCDMVNS